MKHDPGFSIRFCLVMGCLLFLGGILTWQGPPAAGDVFVSSTEKTFGSAPAGTKFPVTFALENRSSAPVIVAGLHENYCMAAGCIRSENLPLTIPAGKTADVRLRVEAHAPGVFDAPVTLFTSCPGRGRLDIRVRGEVVNTSSADGPPRS